MRRLVLVASMAALLMIGLAIMFWPKADNEYERLLARSRELPATNMIDADNITIVEGGRSR
jgi:hypothetical protein